MLDNRFEVIHAESVAMPLDLFVMGQLNTATLRDKVTGALYLYTESGQGRATMTPLVDSNGKQAINTSV
ncbi:MAG: DUF6440 family protein [Turicibacter sp.]|nr:DUF6440 family protein [Turicibacter sp.]